MATVNSRGVVDDIIAHGGEYPGDPPVLRIVEYNNMFDGHVCWGLAYFGEDIERYLMSPNCRNPHVIWEHPHLLDPTQN